MWTSTIANTDYRNGVLIVNVVYSSDQQPPVNNVTQAIDMTGGNLDTLNRVIQTKIDTLNSTDNLISQIDTGPFTPVVPPPDAEQTAISALSEAKRLVDLGLITQDDPQYTDALSQAQSAISKSDSNDSMVSQ